MKNVKSIFFFTVFCVSLIFSSCYKNESTDIVNLTKEKEPLFLKRSDFENTTIPWFMTNRLIKFDELAFILDEPSFQERWGNIDFKRDFSFTTENLDTVKFYLTIKDTGERNIIMSSKNQNTNGVFIISENFELTEENVIGTPIDKELIDGFFTVMNDNTVGNDGGGSVLANELEDGCYQVLGFEKEGCLNIVCLYPYDWAGHDEPGNPHKPHTTGFPTFNPGGPYVGGHGPSGGGGIYPGGHWNTPGPGDVKGSGNIDDFLDKFSWTIINKKLRTFKTKYDLDIPVQDLYNIIGKGCFTINKDADGLLLDVPFDEECAKDALVADFETRNSITLTPDEREIIKDNPFLIDLLQEYMDCMATQDPDPNRRNLGRVANFIRDTYLDSEIEKRMFEKFMLGDDSIEAITPEECAEIIALIQNDPNLLNWHYSHDEDIDGELISHWTSGGLLYQNEKYNLALGTTDFTTNDDGDVIGISDTYDFDIHENTTGDTFGNTGIMKPLMTLAGVDCEGRTFKAEWQTRMVAVWGAIKWRSKSFEVSCP